MWTVVPALYSTVTAPHIQSSIFNWTYLRCYWIYLDNDLLAKLQTLCQIQRTSSRLRSLNGGPSHIQSNYSCTYSGFNIQQNIAPLLLGICWEFTEHDTATLVPIQRTAFSLRSVNCGPGHIHCKYSSAYSGFNIQLKVPLPLLEISRQFNERYTGHVVPNTALNQCSRTYTM
jgi:hypothetical protein